MNIARTEREIRILVIIAIIFTISVSQPILFPLIFSFFLYLLLNPVLEWMVKLKLPKMVASALIVGLLFGLISSSFTFLIQPASSWIESAPANLRIVEQKFQIVKKSLGKINKVAETAQNFTETKKKSDVKVVTQTTNFGYSLLDLTSNILLLLFTILIFLFFLLVYFKTWIQKLDKVLFNRKRILKESNFLVVLKNEVSTYLFTFSLICAGLGIVVAFSFWLLGLPNAILWGFMAMLLTFIPYLGHLIGIMIILFVSLITFDSYIHIFVPPGLYFLLTVLEGQFITPIFLGNRLNLNPLIIFLSIFIWGLLWGISGIIISVPILVTIKIVLEHFPELSRYKVLLEK